jgi:hypothetical protein
MNENNNNKIYDPVEVDDEYFAANEKEQEAFYSKIKTLPSGVVDVLFGLDTADIIKKICTAASLNTQQSAELSRLIRKILIADIYIGDMAAQISSSLGIDQNTALEIARAITSQLFAPVIEDIKKLQLQKFGKLPGLSTPQPSLQRPPQHIPGEDLPETGGNIIDLRNKY